jgi:hypothetical protein
MTLLPDDEETFLACVRVADMSDPVKGSTVETCVHCGAQVWVSPSGEKTRQMYKHVKVGCLPCMVQHAQEDGIEMHIPNHVIEEAVNELLLRKGL